jgi:hypothetical protein
MRLIHAAQTARRPPQIRTDYETDSYEEDPLGAARGIINGLICSLVILALLAGVILLWPSIGHARTNNTQPIAAPQSLLKARHACPNTASLVKCRAALRHAYDAVHWQRHERLHQGRYGVDHAIRLASALYGVPLSEMRRVGTCESHLTPTSKNRSSTASGLFQFLDSTWNRAGIPGFSVFDPYANAIATARLVTRDHGWHEWSCQP